MTPEERAEILDIDEELLKLATPAEMVMYEKALEIENDLKGIYAYMKKASPAIVKPYKHTLVLCDYLDALFEGRLYDDGPGPAPIVGVDENGEPTWKHPERGDDVVWKFAIHAPPRHGKSLVVSEHLPAYLLTKYPEVSGILAGYETEFAEGWGAKVRDHIMDLSEHFGITLSGGKNAAKGWFTLKGHKGEMKCSGAGGSITGRGGGWLILDDPISNSEDAMSATIRQKHEDWWYSTWVTRREYWPDGTPARCIAMFTRWHEDDLRPRVIDKEVGRWCILNMPAICELTDDEPTDPCGREPGQPLCTKLAPLSELIDMRKDNALWFESMYQGRPFLADGNLIKKPFQHYTMEQDEAGGLVYVLWFIDGKKIRVPERNTHLFATMDLAASVKTTADWTVVGQFLVTKTNPRYLIVRHIERGKMDTDSHYKFLAREHTLWAFKYVIIEKASFGINLINALRRQNKIQIREGIADRDKVTRVHTNVLPVLEMRQLFFPLPGTAPWYVEFEKEILKFNNGTHDDQVDVLSMGCQEFQNMPAIMSKPDEATGMEGRIQRKFAAMRKGRTGRALHPELGRY